MGKSYAIVEGALVTRAPYWGWTSEGVFMTRFPAVELRKYNGKTFRNYYLINVYGKAAVGLEKLKGMGQFQQGTYVNAIGRMKQRQYVNNITGKDALSIDIESFDCEPVNSWKYEDVIEVDPSEMEFSEGNLGEPTVLGAKPA